MGIFAGRERLRNVAGHRDDHDHQDEEHARHLASDGRPVDRALLRRARRVPSARKARRGLRRRAVARGLTAAKQPVSANDPADSRLVAVRAGGRVLCRGTATLVRLFVRVPRLWPAEMSGLAARAHSGFQRRNNGLTRALLSRMVIGLQAPRLHRPPVLPRDAHRNARVPPRPCAPKPKRSPRPSSSP